jgi:hypothetical protein
VWDILRIILGIFAVLMVILYYTGIYFSIYDDEKEVERRLIKAKK